MNKAGKKVLFVATVDSHIELFHLPYLKMFHDKGWEVHVATETGKKIPYCDKKIKLPIKRSPFKLMSNHRAIKKLREVAKKEKYDIVHCHTPVGGVVARLACKKLRREGLRMIYTAHGFHFYTGAPIHYWMMFYPVEWYLAKHTDTLITINDEDYQRAKKRFSKRCRDIQYVPGVGVDEKKFAKKMSTKEKHALRESLGLKDEDKVLICVGRLDKNKNQGFLIRVMKELIAEDASYQLLLVGPDEINGKYQRLAEKIGVSDHVYFLGFREDIPELLQISDIAVSASKREGLPVNLIEAAMLKLPIVATDCRGNRDICKNVGGMIVRNGDIDGFIKKIAEAMKSGAKDRPYDNFEIKNIYSAMGAIYSKKKRVLHVLASDRFSGAENVACMIIRNLSKEFDMAYCSPNGLIEKKIKEMNIKYYPINKLNCRNLKKVIKQYSPDVIHAHDYKASLMASKFGRQIRIISHIHQDSPKVKKRALGAFLYRFVSTRFSAIVWASDASFNNFYYHDIVKDKSVVLRNVVDCKYLEEQAKKYRVVEGFDVVFLGRLVALKNPLRALEIIRLVKVEKDDVRMAVIGEGEERETMEKTIVEYKLRKNITMFGFKENPYPILNSSKVLLMTSRREGTPMAVLEAQALRKPVVSTKIDGLEELIINDENGLLSNKNKKLAEGILRIIGNDSGYDSFSKNTKSLFLKTNKFEKYLECIVLIYSEWGKE